MADSSDPALYGPPAHGESQPFHEFALTLARYVPFVLLFAAAAAVAMFGLTAPAAERPTASAQIGLTQQVVWPFYDAARERAVTTLELPDFSEELAARLNVTQPFELVVDAPDNQAFLNIEVTAGNAQDAAILANEATALLLERDQKRLAAEAQADLEIAQRALDASQARADETRDQLELLVPVEAKAKAASAANPTAQGPREEVLRAEIERESLSSALNEETRRQISLKIDVDEATTAYDVVQPELEILGRAQPPDSSGQRSAMPVIAAALGAIVLGLGVAIVWDRTRGLISSRWHAEQIGGVPVLVDFGPRRNQDRAPGLLVSQLVDAAAIHGNIIAVTALPGVDLDAWMQLIVRQTEYIGFDVVALAESTTGPARLGIGDVRDWGELERSNDRGSLLVGTSTITLPSAVTLVDATIMRSVLHEIAQYKQLVLIRGDEIGERQAETALALADATVMIGRRSRNRVDQLRRAAGFIRNRRTEFLGLVLGGRELPTPVLPASLTNGGMARSNDPSRASQLTR